MPRTDARPFAGLRLPDALIAATAITLSMMLATRNHRDFDRVPGLALYPETEAYGRQNRRPRYRSQSARTPTEWMRGSPRRHTPSPVQITTPPRPQIVYLRLGRLSIGRAADCRLKTARTVYLSRSES